MMRAVVWVMCAAVLWAGPGPGVALGAPPAAKEAGPVEVTVLRTAPDLTHWTSNASLWRYHETWRTDLVRTTAGKLVRVDPFDPRVDFSAAKIWREQNAGRSAKEVSYDLRETTTVAGSTFPPADWTQPGFDDGSWVRTATPMQSTYRSVALVCMRGKFEVIDPAQVTELSLAATFHGGAVFHLNGREIGRAFLPAGKLDFDTPAADYPLDAFLDPAGDLLRQNNNSIMLTFPLTEEEYRRTVKDPELERRYGLRFRRFEAKVPTSMLRKGTNVLAVEVHRAPAAEAMFTRVNPKSMGYNLIDHRNYWWNRASVEQLTLTAKTEPGALLSNTDRPKTVQLWNWPVTERVDPRLSGDPCETVKPIRITGSRNGTFAGQVVVSSSAPVTGLRAEVTDLKGPAGATIAKSSLRINYPTYSLRFWGMGFDALEDAPPDTVDVLIDRRRQSLRVAMQPVWLSVKVPVDARAGDYTGTLTVSADGLDATPVPVELHVSGFALPDPQRFVTHMGIVQSPSTLAIRYDVPMWSEAHWKLIERSFAVIGSLANKELTVPLLRQTHFGNEHAMLWWVKRPDGTFEPDFRIVERTIDLAVRHMGKLPVIIFYISEGEEDKTIPWITVLDPSTGELVNATGPRWGTGEARAFWKPAFDGFRRILAKHGLESSLALGYHAAGGNGPVCSAQCIDDLKQLVPEGRWVRLGHFWFRGHDFLEKGPNGNPWARVGLVGNYGVYWNPDTDRPFYGWQNPYVVTAYTRGVFHAGSPMRDYRLCPEAILLTGHREDQGGWGICDFAGLFGRDTFLGMRGFAPWGGDFWPVLRGQYGQGREVIARFNDPSAAHWDPRSSWSTVALNNFQVTYVVGDGETGPVSTTRAEILREGLQEADTRVFVQNALLDDERRAKLDDDLARRADRVCRDRTWALRYLSEFSIAGSGKSGWATQYIFQPTPWQELSRELYDVAADVERALGRN